MKYITYISFIFLIFLYIEKNNLPTLYMEYKSRNIDNILNIDNKTYNIPDCWFIIKHDGDRYIVSNRASLLDFNHKNYMILIDTSFKKDIDIQDRCVVDEDKVICIYNLDGRLVEFTSIDGDRRIIEKFIDKLFS